MSVLLETSLGDVVIDLFWEKAALASKNFIKLCKNKYYNGALFYDIQKNYLTRIMHESTPPTSLNYILYGEQAKYFEDQIDPEAKHNKFGTVSTANVGPNMNDSNFFMTLSNNNIESLNGKHTIFGIVVEGLEVLQKLNDVYVDEQNRPYKNIRILHTAVLDDPFDDPPGIEFPENSPEINYDATDRLDINDQLDLIEGHGRTEEEIIEETKRHEAKTKAIVLEMLNDLPDADIKPPDNVLFVCKLNPVTQEDDLETIFSQFGPIKSCQIIRDWKTGDSLQYSFIEFETAAACEEAFFKMENALIDERRIHVDFSQSVSQYWHRFKSGKPMAYQNEKGGKPEGGKSRYNPKLELKSQHRQGRGDYGIVIDENEAHQESRRHRDNEKRPQRQDNEKRPQARDTERRPQGRDEERRPQRRDDEKRLQEQDKKYRPKSKSRSRSRSKDRKSQRDRYKNSKKYSRSRSRSPRRDRGRERHDDRGREKNDRHDRKDERQRNERSERGENKKEREHKEERDRRRSPEKKKRKQSSSRSSSSSSSSSSSRSRSSS